MEERQQDPDKQESQEAKRFRDLTRRLLAVPKKEINGQPEGEKKARPSRSTRRK
ncbi:MAG: hypothetical protein ACRDH8_00320 [Actinomycetota bacterium]